MAINYPLEHLYDRDISALKQFSKVSKLFIGLKILLSLYLKITCRDVFLTIRLLLDY
jgi:hypothetical protein